MGLAWYTHYARGACHICLSGIDTLGINRTYRNRKTDRICICIRFVLYRDGIACAKEGTLRKCEGHDAVSVLEPLEGVGRPVRPIPRCDARDCRTCVCVRRPLSLPLQANVIYTVRPTVMMGMRENYVSKRGCKQGEQPRQKVPGNRPRVN